MTDDTSAPVPDRSPCELPLAEQVALFKRLKRGRQRRPPNSWQQLAIEERFVKRTVEHFYMRAWELEENADKRPDLVIAEERACRFIHAQATAMPTSRTLVPLSDVPDDLVFPPLCREFTPCQLPLHEQATLFAELHQARQLKPPRSWKYLAVAQGFAERPLERFYRSAMKLEKNADKRTLAQIYLELAQARKAAMPVGRRSDWGLGEVGVGVDGRAVDPRRTRTDRRRARKARSAAETDRSEALLRDERRMAEAREVEWQRRHAQEHLARTEEMIREAAEEGRWEAEEEQLRERDPLRQLMEVWDSSWGPRPVDSPFDV